MKFAIVLVVVCFVFGLALAAPAAEEVSIVRSDSSVNVDGYQFDVETSDGKVHSEEGQLKNVGAEDEAIVVRGKFSYIGDDGITYSVNYVADENGFQPEGAHLPVAPIV